MAIDAASSYNPDPENGPAESMGREFSRITKEVLMEALVSGARPENRTQQLFLSPCKSSQRSPHLDTTEPSMLSHFSHVRLYVTPQTAAHQTPLSLGFSRHDHWSGLSFPSPMQESEVAQSCLTLSDPMDCSPPGSSIHGILQTSVLEWGAI